MLKAEGEDQISRETAEDTPRLRAIHLIKSMYDAAGARKSVNNIEGELQLIDITKGMGQMAVCLGVLAEAEIDELHKEYWKNRSDIPQNFPDRFK